MNREIKFRCFYRGNMHQVKELTMYMDGSMGVDSFIGEHFSPDSEHCSTLMQFSGLKDKYGVDIYEGDFIVDYKNALKGVVYFYAPQFIVQTVQDNPYQLAKGMVNVKQLLDSEIIGNIYANPELLTS